MNCVNCGAPIINGKCDYCGAEYHKSNPLQGSFDEYQGEITIGGKKMRCYIGDMQIERVYDVSFNRNGDLSNGPVTRKRKITLIEY